MTTIVPPQLLKLHYTDTSGSSTEPCRACEGKAPIGHTKQVSVRGEDLGWICVFHYQLLEALIAKHGPTHAVQLFRAKHPQKAGTGPGYANTSASPVTGV